MPQDNTLQTGDARQFQSDLAAVCGAFRVYPANRPSGSVRAANVGGFDIVRVATNASAIERDERAARRDHEPHYFLIRQLAGSATMSQRGHKIRLAPGDFFLASSTRPSVFRYGVTSLQASLHLPRVQITERLGRNAASGLHLPAASVIGRAMSRAVGRLEQGPDQIAELIAIAAQETDHEELRLFDLAMMLIERRCGDPGFGPAALAEGLDVSIRKLQRILATGQISASAAIQDQRMQKVCKLLSTRPDLTVTACAETAGFPDISRFTRDFRQRHGCTPGHYRKSSR
ncbi:helix-turn-helix domain-containing protein [Paracoccus albus]|uniref:helix-turn-helix domain-containing protein n=1 Tax=Paracoccus albus TaxID=3017784 RepID=UPI0022F075EE|nr:helix-turn-helix domain-containing protein [Paracoccus albus]WBU59966.1 helix-turn-helix domain-containing protein [Paracoccus albus]